MRVVSVENAEASGVARALNEIYVRSAQRSRGGEQPIVISELQGSRAILVKANEVDMARIMETVKELDTDEAAVGGEIRVVTLTNSSAEEVLAVLETSLAKPGTRRGRGGGGELAGDVRLSTLAQSNSLVISGDLEEVERLETLARQIDAEGKELNEPKLLKLQYANAAVIMPALEEMFASSGSRGGRRGSTSIPPVFALDENQNAIMVKASASDLSAISSAVALMDTPEAGGKDLLRIIPVPMGINVTDLAEKLESSFNESASSRGSSGSSRGRRSSGSRESISIIADTRTHSLIVSGSATLFDEVEKTVTKLAAAGPPSGGRATRVIRPSNMSADEVRELIEYLKDEGDSTSSSRRSSGRSSGSRRR